MSSQFGLNASTAWLDTRHELQIERPDLAVVQREFGGAGANLLEKLRIGAGARLDVIERDRVVVARWKVPYFEPPVLIGSAVAEKPRLILAVPG